jgi:hypothetical protein
VPSNHPPITCFAAEILGSYSPRSSGASMKNIICEDGRPLEPLHEGEDVLAGKFDFQSA